MLIFEVVFDWNRFLMCDLGLIKKNNYFCKILYLFMKKTNTSILIIDDQEDIIFSLKMLLKKHFENIFTTNNPKDILSILNQNNIDIVLLDMNYKLGFEDGKEGLYFLKEIKIFSPNTSVILMTAFGKIETAVEGLKAGASDYILKPWNNEKLLEVIQKTVFEHRKKDKNTEKLSDISSFFIGNSTVIQKAYHLAYKIALSDANVLLQGENGTGKYVMAQHIHNQSKRKENVFIAIDLGSLNDHIFESELFGYAKGAFTDAKSDKEGKFEQAQNGTIFLDEIGNVPLHLQSKLLQVIQNKTITRLGETKIRPLNVRIITATNLDLKKEVIQKNFREDLYYRINTMEIVLPPLRHTKEDIHPLACFLLNKLAFKYGKVTVSFDKNVPFLMTNYPWHGNVRELQNKIERALILCENNSITAQDLDLLDFVPINDDFLLSDVEKTTIEKALIKNNQNITKTAEELGLSRASLYRRIEKFQINIL